MDQKRFPIPPFTDQSAKEKVQKAQDAWNTKNPVLVSEAYTIDTEWRNRGLFIQGRRDVVNFLTQKWEKELDCKLKKELWCFTENKIAVRFEYEWHDNNEQWFRSYGNEMWGFDENGLMKKRYASINDVCIESSQRKL
jgi:nuclear transport factor 2 (NTF2) superfamily protein